MVNLCLNGTMKNTDNYSSPVPMVGLYIAAAGFICVLLILCDMWAGFRSKKFWFPCRFFSINSITLTLISVATKLPVDLTTTMPRVQDQLSKLSGTVFICMTMSFMLPSLAVNAEFESYANVTALSIFVVTVVVNICIQMATGVIFSFIAEHIIILICMLMLLIRFWTSVTTINGLKGDYTDTDKDLIRNGGKSLLERLQLCYLFGYHYSLQLISCRAPFLADVAPVCMMCSLVFIQAMVRSIGLKDMKFSNETSDYGWSMWLVVVSQVITVAVVSLAVGIRWLINLAHFDWVHDIMYNLRIDDPYLQFQYLFSLRGLPKFLEKSFRYSIYFPLGLINFAVTALNFLVQICIGFGFVKCGILNVEDRNDGNLQEFENLLRSRHINKAETWVLRKSVVDMERWMEINRKASIEHLTNLLSTVPPPEESSYTTCLNYQGLKISSLSLIILVEIAKVMLTPTSRNKVSLANILVEAFDIIQFTDSKLNVGSSMDRLRSMSAQIIHEYGLASGVGEVVLEQVLDPENNKVRFEFIPKPVCGLFEKLSSEVNGAIYDETCQLGDLINYLPHESKEIVYGRIEKLFVDMLHAFLAQLPVAIFAHIVASPVEEYQESVRLCLGFVCKLQPLESRIRFSLPSGSGITSLLPTQTSQTSTQVEGTEVQDQSPDDPATAPEAGHEETQEDAPDVPLPFPE